MNLGTPAPLPIPFPDFFLVGGGGGGGWLLAKSQLVRLAWLDFLGALVQGHLKFTVMQLLISSDIDSVDGHKFFSLY